MSSKWFEIGTIQWYMINSQVSHTRGTHSKGRMAPSKSIRLRWPRCKYTLTPQLPFTQLTGRSISNQIVLANDDGVIICTQITTQCHAQIGCFCWCCARCRVVPFLFVVCVCVFAARRYFFPPFSVSPLLWLRPRCHHLSALQMTTSRSLCDITWFYFHFESAAEGKQLNNEWCSGWVTC